MRAAAIRIVSLLALLGALPALAVFFASWHWVLDLAACFVVQSLWGLLLAAGVLAALGARRQAAACFGGALLAALGTVPDWCRALPTASAELPAASPAAAAPAAIRVLALNLLRGNEAHLADALAVVRAERPDVVFCSEVTPAWCRGLTEGLVDFPHRHLAPDPGYYGVALFSRLPLATARTLGLPETWAPALLALVEAGGGQRLGLLGVHTPRPGDGERNRLRDEALAAIPAAVHELPTAHLVIGDHNATPWNPALRALLADGSLRAATFADWLPTWPTQWPLPLRIPIDHAFVGPGLEVLEVHTGAAFGSDHLPLCVTVRAVDRP